MAVRHAPLPSHGFCSQCELCVPLCCEGAAWQRPPCAVLLLFPTRQWENHSTAALLQGKKSGSGSENETFGYLSCSVPWLKVLTVSLGGICCGKVAAG